MDENDEKIRIERILGLSVTCNAHFDCDSGLIAYPAGNTVVLLDVGSGTVISHIVLETKKPISSIRLKGNSLLFAASDESNFIRVVNWQSGSVKDISPCQNVICCAVSSILGILVTVGSDRVVSVWDFKGLLANNSTNSNGNTPTRSSTPNGISSNARGRKLASSSVAGKVSCVTFSPDGNYFVTGGSRHLKFWYLQLGKNECVLTGRPAILGSEHSSADFRDVITDGQATYSIANFEGSSATLCQLCPRRFLDKWVQLKTNQAFCMCMEEDLIFIGCADGIIRCFRSGKLDFVATLPLPHHLGIHIAAAIDVSALSSHPQGARFPNVVAIGAPGGNKVVAVYADHSMYAWDVQDVKRVGLSHSWLWHSGCIWDVAIGKTTSLNSHTNNESTMAIYNWPSFVTCSNDDTIRCWDITSQTKSNLYSNECLDIKYLSTRYLDSPLFTSHGNGVRCVGIGNSFLCCGDRQGNLRLWDEKAKNEVIKLKAHKEEILAVDIKGTLVATASRDGAINLYNIGEEIERISTMQEHTGSVTCVKLVFSDRVSPLFQLVSCGTDKNLILRQLLPKKGEPEEFSSERNFLHALQYGKLTTEIQIQVTSIVTSKTSLFDLETDTNGKHILVACSDACIRVYNATNGKHSKTLRNSTLSTGGSSGLPTFVKIAVDPSGYYVAAAATDKTLTVFDYYKGDIVATLLGHSELATALRFTPDFQNLFSVGGDSCIFVWALPREMVVTMKARMSEKRSRIPPVPPPKPTIPSPVSASPASTSPVRADYRFNFGQLPSWAKKQITGEKPAPTTGTPKKSTMALPQGKWSERVEQSSGALTIKSFYDSDTIIPMPFTKSQNLPKEVSDSAPLPNHEQKNDSERYKQSRGFKRHDADSRDGNLADMSLKSIDDEDVQSSDFYSDVNKSTDGELSDSRQNKSYHSESDTDDSNSAARTARPSPSKRLIDSFKDAKSSALPYEILKSRNAELIMSVKAKNREISKSRLELEKRLDATRRKLQSIGYKSMSQSTQDLSLTRTFGNDYLDDSDDQGDDAGGIRRACSLSDLNVVPNGTSVHVPRTPSRKRSFSKHKKSKQSSAGVFDPQNLITRSTSMSALAVSQLQSDSEPESLQLKPSYMSKTISSQGKSRRKPSSAFSQENLRNDDDGRHRLSVSDQNLFKPTGAKVQSPMTRSKVSDASVKKPQQIHGVSKGLAVVTGVRQGGREEVPISIELASSSVEVLRKSLDQVIHLKDRLSSDTAADYEPIARILDDGLRSAQNLLSESFGYQDSQPKIISEHEPTVL